ncbi:MAG TPA: pyridoxamine 5'-phosphate oxidase family protein [Dehalococcoidia bacterium]|jgi:predicted pyridoxine 5'-phosphate oxidase superfamily flavin-nucleotide-binding protein|nr:pyridoxamine 5'-phosphate oxidase family protein [Dehalococcoidia bacterium]MEE2926141.1 pyridoxamine 5'-phosphate oxidase family protein [Chloroflexota bacterium]HIB10533.1 pyridoxamine 5'-phosphate oxidase family protein [Dehalococcoidia bacterium]HIM48322.1 pyridoxamine 5'-phosphate oxidase family protein [Dehalococcoidia bacterium]|tara:strand:+ start:1071 stop:1670 length:600 start_codon:yes stop_codon:yes gene_type:complete
MNEKVHDYHDGNRQFQDRFDTRRLADHLTGRVTETIGESQKEFIEKADMFFLATCDHRGLPTCSYKGGDPGFVRVLDERWLAFPNYDGNGKFQSMGNLLKNPNVGMLFVDFEGQQRLRLQGIATILDDDELLSEYPEAQFVIRVQATEVYTNCPRYVHKYQLVERSVFVPRQGLETPVPEYKKREDLQEFLPARDRRPA